MPLRSRSRTPPDPEGWLSIGEAAERLGLRTRYLGTRVTTGHVAGTKHDGWLWIRESTIAEQHPTSPDRRYGPQDAVVAAA